MDDELSAPELDDRIAVLRDNIRQLVEQAAGLSGNADDDRTWDSGLIGPDDQPRPALAVLQSFLGVKPS